jgi:hypothetical protein
MQGSQILLGGVMMNSTAADASVQTLPFPNQTHKQQANNGNFLWKQIKLIQTTF